MVARGMDINRIYLPQILTKNARTETETRISKKETNPDIQTNQC
jgi:hypothetical protein